jgi:hypothetical protein
MKRSARPSSQLSDHNQRGNGNFKSSCCASIATLIATFGEEANEFSTLPTTGAGVLNYRRARISRVSARRFLVAIKGAAVELGLRKMTVPSTVSARCKQDAGSTSDAELPQFPTNSFRPTSVRVYVCQRSSRLGVMGCGPAISGHMPRGQNAHSFAFSFRGNHSERRTK